MTKLTVLLLIGFTMHVSAGAIAQRITLRVNGASIDRVMEEIYRQSGYSFLADKQLLRSAKPVDLQLTDAELEDALSQIFAGQPFGYELADKIITAKPAILVKRDVISSERSDEKSSPEGLILAFPLVKGKIVDSLGNPLAGASIRVLNAEGKRTALQTTTDRGGRFELRSVPEDAVLEVTYVGYVVMTIPAEAGVGTLVLKVVQSELEEVEVMVNTGYQTLPKERATGSFVQVDNELLNRSVGANVLSRLEGVTNGVLFNRAQGNYGEATRDPEIRVRGVSSIFSERQPLIVVDGFPYEQSINTINPNDVESITILKDAAAASIWGTRAGNGVIVVTTKQGKKNEGLEINVNTNAIISGKPDLKYDPAFLPSQTVMELQEEFFESGMYRELNNVLLPSYVELLIAKREGQVSLPDFEKKKAGMLLQDIRDDASRYLYQAPRSEQYALNFRGGGEKYTYYLSGGYDKGRSGFINNSNERLTLSSMNTLKPVAKLSIKMGLNYVVSNEKANGISISDLRSSGVLDPYTFLRNEDGTDAAILRTQRLAYTDQAERFGLLNWGYRPLEEQNLNDRRSDAQTVRVNVGVDYEVVEGLTASVSYQHLNTKSTSYQRFDKQSYYVRDLVNRFTQDNGTQVVPMGDILADGVHWDSREQVGRFQMDYHRNWNKGNLNVLGGYELREVIGESQPGTLVYGFNPETLTGQTIFDYNQTYPTRPVGSRQRMPGPSNAFNHRTNRFVSYYLNGSYRYDKRYLLSFSTRWDASNLFGVKTNQKGVPLWSVGGSWDVTQEDFFNLEVISTLRPRVTYGYNGNVNTVVSTVPVLVYNTDFETNLRRAQVTSTGNPGLRWEKIGNLNLGLDFGGLSNRLTGSFEYYRKIANDLIGFIDIDPTTGISRNANSSFYEIDNRINYASLLTKGVDMQLRFGVINHAFKWDVDILFNASKNIITNYTLPEAASMLTYFPINTNAQPAQGKSMDVLYELPWYGLNPQTGHPIVYVDGEESTNYGAYWSSLRFADLNDAGVTVPKFTNALRNSFSWKRASVSFNVVYKGGHHFRRSSVAYNQLLTAQVSGRHSDFLLRWRNPGDELATQIPSRPAVGSAVRDNVYLYSEQLIQRGDHIRFQDVSIGYTIRPKLGQHYFSEVRLYSYFNNLPIMWRANEYGIDPDYPLAMYPPSISGSLGIQVTF